MDFRTFESQISSLPAFNLNDVRKLDAGFHRQQLHDWLGRGYIQRLAGGYYLLADQRVDQDTMMMLANHIYQPSYISRELALAYYQVIPESVLGVTSVSSRKTMQYETAWGRLSYRSIRPGLMFGYRVVEKNEKIIYKIASLEKAVLDFLYWNAGVDSAADFEGFRWNRERLQVLVNSQTFWKYLRIFNKESLDRRVEVLMEYIRA